MGDVLPTVVAAIASGLLVLALLPAHASRLRAAEPPSRSAPGGGWPVRRILWSVATGAAAWFSLSSSGALALVPASGVAAACYVLTGRLEDSGRALRQQQLTSELPQVCDLLVASLEAGLPLRNGASVLADRLDGPLAKLLAEVVARIRLGEAEERAWAELAAEPSLAAFARELSRGAASGTALSGRLRALGVDARLAAFAVAETRAKKVGVQTVLPLMACFLPAFVLLGVLPIVGGLVLRLVGGW